MLRRSTVAVALMLTAATAVRADVFRPAYLELRQTSADTYDVMWKVPAQGDTLRLAIHVVFPAGTVNVSEPRGSFVGDGFVERWTIRRASGLAGEHVRIEGLPGTITDVLARVERDDGTTQVARLAAGTARLCRRAANARLRRRLDLSRTRRAPHPVGIDHLLYILAMLFLVKGWRRIVATMTAFTATHSLTLTAAALGWVHVPQPPVEACIALSIVFVAREIVQAGRGRSRAHGAVAVGGVVHLRARCTASASPARWRRSACRRERFRSRCSSSTSASRSVSWCSSPPCSG